MLHNLKKRESGFTIVEVMIVLAIAGLIILVVLLAVPALQRNQRNTAMRNNASAIAAGVNEFVTSNSGMRPDFSTVDVDTGKVVITKATDTSVIPVEVKVQPGIKVVKFSARPSSGTLDAIYIIPLKKCNEAGTDVAGSTYYATDFTDRNAVAITFNIETSGGTAPQCIDA